MSSGLNIDDDVGKRFEEFKLQPKSAKKKRALIFKISDDNTRITYDSTLETSSDQDMSATEEFQNFLSSLPPNECRYITYDLEGQHSDGRIQGGIILLSWVPDGAPMKNKMIFASSKEILKSKFEGIKREVLVTSATEISYQEAMGRLH